MEKISEASRKSVTGVLKISIDSVQNLWGKRILNNKGDLVVDIRIDNVAMKSIKPGSSLLRNTASVEIRLDKASEIEFLVSAGEKGGLQAILFFRLCDLEAEIVERIQNAENVSH